MKTEVVRWVAVGVGVEVPEDSTSWELAWVPHPIPVRSCSCHQVHGVP